MIYGITAKIGHGKGCFASAKATLLADQGRDVYANFPIFDKRITTISTWAEVADLGECDVFIDEAHLWFPARETHAHGKVETMTTWAQSRHDGINLWWISQKPGLVDLQIREVYTHDIYRIKRLFGPTSTGKPTELERKVGVWAVVRRYDSEQYHAVTKRVQYSQQFFRLDKWWGTYDTHYIIGDRFGKGVREGRSALAPTASRVPLTRQQYLYMRETAPLVAPGQWEYSLDDTIGAVVSRPAPAPRPVAPAPPRPAPRPQAAPVRAPTGPDLSEKRTPDPAPANNPVEQLPDRRPAPAPGRLRPSWGSL